MATKKYFEDKLVEVSNTYMSATGGQQIVTTSPNAGPCGVGCKIGRFQSKYFDFGGMFGKHVGAIAFYGLILGGGYMIYRSLKK